MGTWDSNGHTYQFRSDGTFAEMEGRALAVYTQKCAQDTGECGPLGYPATATSTGLWSMVTNPSQEIIPRLNIVPNPLIDVVLSKVMKVSLADNIVIVHLNDGMDPAYAYLAITFSADEKKATFRNAITGDPEGVFTKLNDAPSPQSASYPSSISVPGMSKYTDSDFGFSFWYPSGWTVSHVKIMVYASGDTGDNPFKNSSSAYAISKVVDGLKISDGKQASYLGYIISQNGLDSIYSGVRIDHIYFDPEKKQWKDDITEQNPTGYTNRELNVSDLIADHTMGGLPYFFDEEVPLNSSKFLIANDNEGPKLKALMKTIIATDPSVATPVSADEQIKTIQAEKEAYNQ